MTNMAGLDVFFGPGLRQVLCGIPHAVEDYITWIRPQTLVAWTFAGILIWRATQNYFFGGLVLPWIALAGFLLCLVPILPPALLRSLYPPSMQPAPR